MFQDERLGEYTCPICQLDLAHVKSSYLRQQHVEKCLTTNETKIQEEFEIYECVFCGKSLKHFKYNQKQVHLNTCLDDIKEEEEQEFAGQSISFLNTLEICPVCHETIPFLNRNLNQKLKHTKKCSKEHKLTLSQLLQKFQWIGWGHLPIAHERIPSTTTTTIITPKPTHTLTTTTIEEDDDDFCDNIIIHKTNNQLQQQNRKRNREKDKIDEQLQLAIGLSKSMSIDKVVIKKQRIGVTPLNERDWNAANIWSAEESKRQVIAKLDELLFPDNIEIESFKQQEREKSIGYLNQSKLNFTSLFYWNLSSNKELNWDDPSVFKSLFLQNQHF